MIRSNKRRHNKNAFKSHTDVNNYNHFLAELDKLHRATPKEQQDVTPKPPYKRENLGIFLKETNKTFTQLNTEMFTGRNPWDLLIDSIEEHLEIGKRGEPKQVVVINDKDIPNTNTNTNTDTVPEPKKQVIINMEINNIGDLLTLINTYPDDNTVEYNIDIKSLHKIREPLIQLDSMIGMKNLKENIVDQIIFYIQHLHTLKNGNDFMHTVIYGPPGTGKTEIAKIIGSIFSKMGILSKGTFKKVTRSDLIAGYLGQTALKTRDVIKECLGGVLFIDEAYALGNEEKRDSFSKECIDTLCEALSDFKDDLMVIVAGYETDLNNCFFNYNQGLNSRFTWRFKTDDYSAEDLYNIFIKKVNDGGWFLTEESNVGVNVKWFEKNKAYFKFYGRDIETLFAKTKIAHSRRVFCLDPSVKKRITLKDIDRGLEIYLKNEDSANKEKENRNKIIYSMYV